MDSTTSTMQQLIQNLVVDLCKNFEQMHRQLINLDKSLHAIEQARIQGDADTPSSPASKLDWIRKPPSTTLQQKPRKS